MIRKIIKIDIGQIVQIGEYCLMAEYNLDRVMKTDLGIIRTIEVTLEEEILEVVCNPQIRIIEAKTLELDTEGIIETLIMKERRSRSRDRHYSGNTRMNDSSSSRSRSGSRASTKRDRMRYY